MSDSDRNPGADTESARLDTMTGSVAGIGVGMIAMMLTWLVGQRTTALLWAEPAGPVVALAAAVGTAILVTIVSGRRLCATLRRPPR